MAAKFVTVYDRSVWNDVGANGLSEGEGVLGSTWAQRDGVLSALVPPERLGYLLAVPEHDREALVQDELERLYGAQAREWRELYSARGASIRTRAPMSRTGGRAT